MILGRSRGTCGQEPTSTLEIFCQSRSSYRSPIRSASFFSLRNSQQRLHLLLHPGGAERYHRNPHSPERLHLCLQPVDLLSELLLLLTWSRRQELLAQVVHPGRQTGSQLMVSS